MFGRFEIKFLNSTIFYNHHPGFFWVARVYEHARCHSMFSMRPAAYESGRSRDAIYAMIQSRPKASCG
jgi:hypothetical protein